MDQDGEMKNSRARMLQKGRDSDTARERERVSDRERERERVSDRGKKIKQL